MEPPLLRLEGVCKSFTGRTAVDRLSFEVRPGEVFALLGPNGAGKTTTVRMLIGIIRPDAGRIEVRLGDHGHPTDRLPPLHTGYMPEDRGLYREIGVLRTLVYFGRLRGLGRREARDRAREWLERMGLLDRAKDRLDALSKGNQQRVQLIAALLHGPAVAILDEPFSGLDPLGQEAFLQLVEEIKNAGTTILLSSHQMDLVERAADRFLLMNRGRQILAGSLAELRARLDARPRLLLRLAGGGDAQPLRDDPDVEQLDTVGEEARIVLRAGAVLPEFLARTVKRLPVSSITSEAPRLHDMFVHAVSKDEASKAGMQEGRQP